MKALYNEHWKTRRIEVTQASPKLFDAVIELYSKNEVKTLICEGSTDVSALLEAFDSYRIEVEENPDSQVEFGKFKLCFTSDSYFEVYFDRIYEKNT